MSDSATLDAEVSDVEVEEIESERDETFSCVIEMPSVTIDGRAYRLGDEIELTRAEIDYHRQNGVLLAEQ